MKLAPARPSILIAGILLAAAAILAGNLPAHSQALVLRLQAAPATPDPGETVTLEVITFSFDRRQASYRWRVNGVSPPGLDGGGNYRLSVSAGAEGESKTVGVEVTAPDGTTHSAETTIKTMSAPLYWWADTLIPYWYRGKALPAVGSSVSVIALPNVPNVNSLDYQWEFNTAARPDASGVGKATFTVPMNFAVEERASVLIQDPNGAFAKTAAIGVKPVSPRLNLHEVREGRGVIPERSLAVFRPPERQPYELMAVPYFFPAGSRSRLGYRWELNGQEVAPDAVRPWRLALPPLTTATTSQRLAVFAKDSERPAAAAKAAITIQPR